MFNVKLAIITARGGSKRIPRKNIRNFCGKPIIAYSIEAALKSGCFDEVMVSTDDEEIAQIALKYGAVVPFKRSEKASDDFATTADVILEVLNQYQPCGKYFEYACCIYPTAPLILPENLQSAFNQMTHHKVDTVFPIVRFSFPIQRALRLDDGSVGFIQPEYALTRSQDLEPAYHDAGQFYWLNVKAFIQNKLLISKKSGAIVLSEWQVQDIDNMDDWIIAEMKYNLMKKQDIKYENCFSS